MQVVEFNPFRCRVWDLHSRLDENISEESCKAEIESFERDGQLVPVLGRRLRGDNDHDVELIFGARRLFVARHLNKPLHVELRDISDREGIIAMEAENRLRKDIGPYERGLAYSKWLSAGYFGSQEELAASLQLSASRVSRLLRLARIPSDVVNAFGNIADIRQEWGVTLVNLLEQPQSCRAILKAARKLQTLVPRPRARDVWKQLCLAGKVRRRNGEGRVVKDEVGSALFHVKQQHDSILLVLPLTRLSQRKLTEIELAVRAAIERCEKKESFEKIEERASSEALWN